ncbi:hypothetical protein BGX38DRAFT_1206778 [Terfezia claveryi]|nr:hypothetical protein BGX38DRAFT_1206778 [Terfezia claveryi]
MSLFASRLSTLQACSKPIQQICFARKLQLHQQTRYVRQCPKKRCRMRSAIKRHRRLFL